jgi:beta-lactamase superfamily II metal-dependent hydrolase
MLRLHVLQAEYGDCFILELRSGKRSVNVLIDGGPYQTFDKHLKPTLQKLPLNGKLDLMVLSHIDNDHIIGLLDLMEHIKNQKENGTKELVSIEQIWHNSFVDLLHFRNGPQKLIKKIAMSRNMTVGKNILQSLIMKGFQQGTDLTMLAKLLKIPINQDFKKIIVINNKIKSVHFNDIVFDLLGPTKINVDKLRKEWNDWYKKKKPEEIATGVQILDKSVPNLASITFLVEIDNKKILFTGDGIGNDIVDVLSKNALLDSKGKFYVDILKVPHHGSERNTTPEFFNTVRAEYYVISANGRDDNPSFNTLKWIIESKDTIKTTKKIILTNMTPNVQKIMRSYDSIKFNYKTILLEKKSNFLTINL